MTVIDPGFETRRGEQVGSWLPTRFTPSLTGTENFPNRGNKLIDFALRYWSVPDIGKLTNLDPWQEWLIRHVLEVYPDDWPVEHLRGQLRFRQVVISMGRQNGKSLLAALFILYFLCLHVKGPRIIGLASIERQAKIVYDRVRYGIDSHPSLSAAIKTTGTRGITVRDGSGIYQTLPAKEESAQGEPSSGSVYDELHLGLAALWDALVLSQRARDNALLVGITTAGDDSSELLIRLYRDGEAAIAGEDERFGFFCWEAESDELTEDGVIAANPGVACGRIPFDTVWSEAVKAWRDNKPGPDGLTGRQRVIRYTLNRFIAGAADAWVPTNTWTAGHTDEPIEHADTIVFGLDRTSHWEHACITATSRTETGHYLTELVASFNEPDHALLLEACKRLARRGSAAFAMDSSTLGPLADDLKRLGLEVWKLGATETMDADASAHGIITRGILEHPGDPLVSLQMARARGRTTGDRWKVSRAKSLGHIDTVTATRAGLYVASIRPDDKIQLF